MSLLHIAGGATEDKLDASDVFSAYVRTGTGADVTVTTNIDMTKGYMVWTKGRSGATDHAIYDSARGVTKDLVSNSNSAETTKTTGLKSVSTTGHTIGSLAKMNANGATYVDWVFKKAPKFFDIVTYTGNGVVGRQIPHNLGCEVGMIETKATSTTGDWNIYHRSATGDLKLNLSDAQTASKTIIPSATTTTFTVNVVANTNGVTYVAYLFAHDPSADGIIQCGSFTPSAGVDAVVNLGWEPQFLLVKSVEAEAVCRVLDISRGLSYAEEADLYPNGSNAENVLTGERFVPTASGFYHKSQMVYSDGSAVIYLAIRRPNKVPTSGTEVFQPIVYTGTNADNRLVNTTIAPDMVMVRERNDKTPLGMAVASRLTCDARLQTSSMEAELTDANSFMTPTVGSGNSFNAMNGFGVGNDAICKVNADIATANNHIALAFKRAKGFFDVVCYTGTGVARTVNHSLWVVPELMIVKCRSSAETDWLVYHSALGASSRLYLNAVFAVSASQHWANTAPTAEVFTVSGAYTTVGTSGNTYVAYLFATLAGISKVGSYTGNGTSQTIPCGFSTGVRFVLIKRTDSDGDWYIWDSARGIVAANDPHLSLNTTAAEVTTDDSIDPDVEGFICNQNTATNINVLNGTYIFLAIA